MKEELIRKFVEKLDYSYNYKTVNERQNIINELCEIAGIEQFNLPHVIVSLPGFLYEDGGEIRVGVHGDSSVTDEWNRWRSSYER